MFKGSLNRNAAQITIAKRKNIIKNVNQKEFIDPDFHTVASSIKQINYDEFIEDIKIIAQVRKKKNTDNMDVNVDYGQMTSYEEWQFICAFKDIRINNITPGDKIKTIHYSDGDLEINTVIKAITPFGHYGQSASFVTLFTELPKPF